MLKIKSLFFVCLFIVFAVASVIAQTTNLKSVKHEISDGKLKIDFEYEQDATAFANSKLIYQRFNSSGADGGLQPLSFVNSLTADRTKFTFVIPSDALKDAIAIEFFMELTDSQIRFKSPTSRVDVKYLTDLNQARKDNVALTEENQKLNDKVKQRDETIATLSAKITPSSIFLVERKMLSDEKVILLFGTNVAGKIRATIKGPDSFSKSAISKVVSDRHLIEFTGLKSVQDGGGEYVVEAIALNVNEGDKEIPAVKATFNSYPSLKFTTPSESINKPILSIDAKSKNPSSIDVSVTLDQKGFIEVVCEEKPDQTGTKGRLRRIGQLSVTKPLCTESA